MLSSGSTGGDASRTLGLMLSETVHIFAVLLVPSKSIHDLLLILKFQQNNNRHKRNMLLPNQQQLFLI